MSFEIAFKVKRDSEFYRKYFEAKEERQKFRGLAVPFFEKHGIDGRFYQSKTLGVNPAWLMGLDVPMTAGEDEPTDERTQLLNRIIPLIKQMKIEQLKLALSLFEQFQ